MAKPVITHIHEQKKPVLKFAPPENSYTFSFKYFQQTKYFGLSETETAWCVAFLDRLRDFNNIDLNRFFSDRHLTEWWRFHAIDWNATNIPIRREELTWLPRPVMDNAEEFPLHQFQVSTTRGRVIGFDWENVFYIVLLDPLHNLQPSKDYRYAVDDCYPLSSQYDSLVNDIEIIKGKTCTNTDCEILKELKLLPKKLSQTNALVAYLDDATLKTLEETLKTRTLTNIIELGLLSLM